MSWDLEPEEIYAFATGGGEPLAALEVATLPDRPPLRRGGRGKGQRPAAGGGPITSAFPNLDTCIELFSSTRSWRAPVVAAAQAGLWDDDVAPPEWQARLDLLERALERVRRGAPEPPHRPSSRKRP